MRARFLAAMLAVLIGLVVAAQSRGGSGRLALAQQPPSTPAALPAQPVPATATPPSLPVRAAPLPPPAVTLDRMNVTVEIIDLLAASTVDLVFKNATDRPQEGTLLFPVAPGVAISDFTMTVDGQTLEGEILGREEAARIYADIVRRQRDPALLEYVGQNVLRARVFPIPPRGESRLTLRFSQLLTPENGAVRYRLPLTAGADAGPTLSQFSISVRVSSSQGVRSLFSPTHDLHFNRKDETEMSGSLEQRDVAARGTFELNALLSGDAVAAGMIAYRTPGEDGFFMLWLAPPLRQEAVVEKDVVLVLDVSGSMAGRKIDQAKAALRFVLGRLNPGDRFNVISFSSAVDRFATGLRPAADAEEAIAYVNRLRAEGGTNIDGALLTALQGVDRERLTTVVFLTDGEPTVGEQNPARILEHVSDAAPPNVRLFVFGVGNDVNTILLDGLAVQNHGDVAYVRPEEDVEEAVSLLYNRISSPQLTDVRLDFGDALVYDIYPQPLPDLFGGQTLFVTGRYRNTGAVDVRLSGSSRDGQQTFTFPGMQLAEGDRRASYLPRLWASRKVGALLREIRLRGPERSRELIDEVVALSTRYGIITPYTSFIVQEQPVNPQNAATRLATAAAAPAAGAGATGASAQTGAVAAATPGPARTSTPAPRPSGTPAPGGATTPASTELAVTYVGEKAFVLRAGVWTDTAYLAGTDTQKVVFASDAYFELLARKPELAPFFALGERVIVVLDGVAYEVTG
jgi:Ca-activated chloride channel family protein